MTDRPAGSRLQAALWVLAGALAFSVVYASGRLAGGAVPALVIVWVRYLSGFVTVSFVSLARHGSLRPAFASRKYAFHGLRALCGIGGLGCSVYAATAMPLADAAALKLLQGVFIMVLAVLLLRERVPAWHALAAALCLGGAAIIVRGTAGGIGFGSLLAAGAAPLVALLAALLVACETILIKYLARTETALSMLFLVNGCAALAMTAVLPWIWVPVAPAEIGPLFLLGPLAIAGQMCNIRGFRLADAAWLAPFGYSSVAFAALIGWAFYGDLPGAATLGGTALIVAGGLLLIRR
jgi:drug/metabolite transporter (DMT)-like permease